jgi:hypothetical protein
MTPRERESVIALALACHDIPDPIKRWDDEDMDDLTLLRAAKVVLEIAYENGDVDGRAWSALCDLLGAHVEGDKQRESKDNTGLDHGGSNVVDALDDLMRVVSRCFDDRADRILKRTQNESRRKRNPFNRSTQRIADGVLKVFEKYEPPLGVRQVYYQLAASLGLVPLSQKGYREAARVMLRMRELEIVPWGDFCDRARERHRPGQWADVHDFMETVNGAFRKDKWRSQPEHVEFWLEKDALSAFVKDVLDPYGNPLCVVRGFSSATFLHECAAALSHIKKPKFIYYLGDHDPSGLSIEDSIKKRLTEFGAEFTFKRIAVTLDDTKTYNLRPLEAKKTDTRTPKYVKKHGTATIELDALPPDVLRQRIIDAVEKHIDADEWRRAERAERVERESVLELTSRLERFRAGEVRS